MSAPMKPGPLTSSPLKDARSLKSAGSRGPLTGAEVGAAARAWLGTPYVHQASAKGAGTDCLGLIRGLYRELYGQEPETPPPYTPNWNERAFARHLQQTYKNAASDQGSLSQQRHNEFYEPLLAAAYRNLICVTGEHASPIKGRARQQSGEDFLCDAGAQLGDVLIFRVVLSGPAKHCGVVSAPGRFIHAYAGRAVVESRFNRWWGARLAGVFRFPGVARLKQDRPKAGKREEI